jgi:hypothetical protein
MTITGKLNNDNGLQDRKTEHQAVTGGMFYCRDSAEINICNSLQISSRFDSEVLRNRQQKHTAKTLGTNANHDH